MTARDHFRRGSESEADDEEVLIAIGIPGRLQSYYATTPLTPSRKASEKLQGSRARVSPRGQAGRCLLSDFARTRVLDVAMYRVVQTVGCHIVVMTIDYRIACIGGETRRPKPVTNY